MLRPRANKPLCWEPGLSTHDPSTFIAVPLPLTLVAYVPILTPARAGMRLDPVVTLRAK
jgi:hypothetical protein